ncbi:MAG: RNA polymerase sigma factor [Phycisphaerae bacterium]
MESPAEQFLRHVRPHWTRLHLVARRYVAHEEDARDLVQETLLRAWRSFSPTQEQTYGRAWLFVIMRSAVWDWHRTARRRIKLVLAPEPELTELIPADLTEPPCPLPATDEERFKEFLDDRIVAALEALNPPFREVLILSVAADLSYREIAEVLDCPVGTVMSRMARARRALRENLAAFAKQVGWVKERP